MNGDLIVTGRSKDENMSTTQCSKCGRGELVLDENGMDRLCNNCGFLSSTIVQKPARDDLQPKTFGQFKEFIEKQIQLQANYQLVMLKYLVNHKVGHKGQIAEELAVYNNKMIFDVEEVKKFFNVPFFDVLEKRGFIVIRMNHGIKEFVLNVVLTKYEEIEINEILEKKLKQYNEEHNIPENQFTVFTSINWNDNLHLIRENTESVVQNVWISSVTYDNWKILKEQNIWASVAPIENLQTKIKHGDNIVFYVIGTKAIMGIFMVVGDWYESTKPIWSDEKNVEIIYKSQVRLKRIKTGVAKIQTLRSILTVFKNKDERNVNLILRGQNGYPSNFNTPIPIQDLERIKENLHKEDSEFISAIEKGLRHKE